MLALLRLVASFSRNSAPTPWAFALLCMGPLDLGKLLPLRRPERNR